MATESLEYSGIRPPSFPRLRPVNGITPFTYQDGSTYLEILNKMEVYIRDNLVPDVDKNLSAFVVNLNKLITDLENGLAVDREAIQSMYDGFTTIITGKVDFINNKTGATDIQQITLTANRQITIDPLWPTNQPVEFVIKQDATGGRTLTYASNIVGKAELSSAANSVTRFTLVPDGTGKWNVIQSPDTLATLDTRVGNLITPAVNGVRQEMVTAQTATDKKIADTATSLTTKINGEITTVTGKISATDARVDAANELATDNGFLFANFLGNGGGYESLSLFFSPDGKTLFGGVDNPAYIPADGYGLRDPSIMYRNGRFYVVYTSRDGQNRDFAIASSATGHSGSWSLHTKVNVASIPGIEKAWAPEFIIDGNDVYVFFSRLAGSIGSMYYTKATNTGLTTWSTPVKLSWIDEPGHHIDGVPVKSAQDNKWYMFYSTGPAIERAVADTITGPWRVDKVGNWAGWGTGIEGPTIIRDGDLYRAYFDRFQAGTGIHWSEASSLNGPWSTPVKLVTAPYVLRKDETIRHGSVLKLTSPEMRNKVIATQTLPQAKGNHAEFQNAPGIPVQKNARTVIQWVVPDDIEMVNSGLVTFSEGGAFRLNALCNYAIVVTAQAKNVTGVNRSFIEMTDNAGTLVHMRASGGAEDVFSFNMATFKPRAAGEIVKFYLYLNWTGAETSAAVPVRVRITRTNES